MDPFPQFTPLPNTRKRKCESRYELLECPVCLELPRTGPLFGCKNGHLICNSCRNQLLRDSSDGVHCPICRSRDLSCRNLIAEKLMEELLDNSGILFNCRFAHEGCKEKGIGRQIEKHEISCWFRQIECPSIKFGSCNWKGPVKNLVKHVASNKCAQILKTNVLTSQFSSSICDFPGDNSVFKRNSKTYWKPVLLFSPLTVAFFIYLTICRDKNGIWSLSAKSYSSKSITESLSVEVNVSSPDSSAMKHRAYSFTGKIVPHTWCEKEVLASGEHLLLSDPQVKSLREDNKLFQYSVKVNKAISKKHPVVPLPSKVSK